MVNIHVMHSKAFQPFLHFGFVAANLMSIDAEAFGDVGLGEGFLHVVDAVGQAAALVGGEGNDGLAGEVDILEEREHHLRVGAPPHGAADEDGVILGEVGGSAFVGGQLAFVGFFLREVDKRRIGHSVVLVGDDFVLVGTRDLADVVGHNLGVADFDVCYVVGSVVADYIVVACMGEENDYLVHCIIV